MQYREVMQALRLAALCLSLLLGACQPQPAERAVPDPAAASGAPPWPGPEYTLPETEGQREFWSRRHLAWNTSVDYRDIERLHHGNVSQVVEVLPLTIRGCRPLVYVDGWKRQFMNDLPLDWVYGIEVYRGYFSIPQRYRDPFDSKAKCGAVLLWTKKPR